MKYNVVLSYEGRKYLRRYGSTSGSTSVRCIIYGSTEVPSKVLSYESTFVRKYESTKVPSKVRKYFGSTQTSVPSKID